MKLKLALVVTIGMIAISAFAHEFTCTSGHKAPDRHCSPHPKLCLLNLWHPTLGHKHCVDNTDPHNPAPPTHDPSPSNPHDGSPHN